MSENREVGRGSRERELDKKKRGGSWAL